MFKGKSMFRWTYRIWGSTFHELAHMADLLFIFENVFSKFRRSANQRIARDVKTFAVAI
jgi:hypothetical protein